jgi:hypothetical protein
MRSLTPQTETNTLLPQPIPQAKVDASAINSCLREWITEVGAAFASARTASPNGKGPDDQQWQSLGSLLLQNLSQIGATRAHLISYVRLFEGRAISKKNQTELQLINGVKQHLIRAKIVRSIEEFSAPVQARTTNTQTPVEIQAPTQPTTQLQAPSNQPRQAEKSHTNLYQRFASPEADIIGSSAVEDITRSGRPICCMTAGGVDIHPYFLFTLLILLSDEQRVRHITDLHIFDPEGKPFIGIEETPCVHHVFDDRSDIDTPGYEWYHWINMLYSAKTLVRNRRKANQALSHEQKMYAPPWDHSLFVFPDWGHWALQWHGISTTQKTEALNYWIERRRGEVDIDFQFQGEFNPAQILRDVAKYGPTNGVLLLISTDVINCRPQSGLMEYTLPNFALLAVGAHTSTGPAFSATQKVAKVLEEPDKSRVVAELEEARQLSQEHNRHTLLLSASSAHVWPAPSCDELLHHQDKRLRLRFAAAA